MRAILTITFSALMLAGCAASYDKTAMPDASVAVHQASLSCEARLAAKDIKTYSEMASCNLAAERTFFMDIKLKNMEKFEAYAANYGTLAADRDANRISDSQAEQKANQMLRQFYAECRCTRQAVIDSRYLPGLHVD
ncbi:MAG: hypothetical protein ABI608_11135 [Rhizomicrobium sp.]